MSILKIRRTSGFLILFISVILFFRFVSNTYAYVPSEICGCDPNTDPRGQYCCYSYDCAGYSQDKPLEHSLSTCQEKIGNPTNTNYCDTNNWIFNYNTCQSFMYNSSNAIACKYQYVYQTYQCSAADSCIRVDGPYLRPGNCDASAYQQGNPASACTTGYSDYKVCCYSDGTQPNACVGGDHSGTCPAGSETKFCGWGPYPPCNSSACKPPKECNPSTPIYGECINSTSREVTTNYYWSDGSGLCDSTQVPISDPKCAPAPSSPPPPPQKSITITLTPSPPPTLVCNQAYGTCGCKPGTGCLDGESTDYRCCYRTCDRTTQACVTRPVVGYKPVKDQLNTNGKYNECSNSSECSATYQGVCQVDGGEAQFKVIGSPCNNCSYAKYSDGSIAWQGESIPRTGPSSGSFTHPVDAGRTFTWYVNGKPFGTKSCNVSSGQCVFDEDCDSAYQCEDP